MTHDRDAADLVIHGGLVLTPDGLSRLDIAVRGSSIARIAPSIRVDGARQVDAGGLHVLPGALDAHVHFGVPIAGTWSRDDAYTGTLAALCGGVTCAGDFTVQDPGEPLGASIERRRKAAAARGVFCDWFLHANVTSVTSAVLDEIPRAAADGVASFKVFLAYPGMLLAPEVLRAVMQRVAGCGGLLMVHCEDQQRVQEATEQLVASGRLAAPHFFASRPPDAEALAVRVVGEMCRDLGAPAYVVHLSSALGLRTARAERALGARLYLETCPQYLLLSQRPRRPLSSEHLICSPPIRLRRDRQALLRALAGGTVDVLATDHCPFTMAQKARGARDFREAPGGLPGVETLLPIAYDLALRGVLPWPRLASVLTETPARLFGLSHRKGALKIGLDADFVLLDPSAETRIEAARLHSSTDYNPYEGRVLRGAIQAVFLRGRLRAQRTSSGRVEPVGGPAGEFVPAKV